MPWGAEGSWTFQILPYIEQQNLHRPAGSGAAVTVDPLRYQPCPTMFFCPSRRQQAQQGGRYLMDYASATPADSVGSWDQFWYNDIWGMGWSGAAYKGVIVRGGQNTSGTWVGGKVTMTGITDGTSNTMVVSEKQLHPQRYMAGDWHDDAGWGDGWDPDVVRYTGFAPNHDRMYDNQGGWEGYRFGSAHISGITALFGDGSVRTINYSVSPATFNALGGRDDGIVATLN